MIPAYHKWRPDFEAVMDPRMYSIGWLDTQIWLSLAWFWGDDRAGIVAELRHYPTGAFDIHGLVAAGDVAVIRDSLIPQAEEWARSIGALGAIIESREGWSKILKENGYCTHQIAVRKELV